jgi:hypothetical protein
MACTPTVFLKLLSKSCTFMVKIRYSFRARQYEQNKVLKLVILFENLTLKMKISFDEVLPPDVLYAGTQKSSNISILGGVLDQNVLFSTFDLENDGQCHTFSRSKYKKHAVSEKLKILSYHM